MESIKRKIFSWKGLAYEGVFFTFLILFWQEFVLVIPYGFVLLRLLIQHNFNLLNTQAQETFLSTLIALAPVGLSQAVARLILASLIFVVFFHLSIFLLAQFALPVRSWEERKKAMESFRSFFGGRHGPVIFVKDGVIVESEGERERKGTGVALINLNSVLVLKGNVGIPKQVGHWVGNEIEMPEPSRKRSFKNLLPKKKKKNSELFRVVGPGIAFIGEKEKIFRSFDLRNQGRKRNIFARTSDGVKVSTAINVGVSLTDEPDLIQVAYVGERRFDNIKGIVLLEDRSKGIVTVKKIFNLDYDDIVEIAEALFDNETNKEPSQKASSSFISSFRPYSEDRLKTLSYAILRGREDPDWLDIPLDIAESIFIRLLSTKTYQELYSFGDAKQFPLEDYIKERFTQDVKQQGLLRFQFIERGGGAVFRDAEGEDVSLEEIEKMPIVDFRSAGSRKILRRYGLKVQSAGFGDLKPENEEITERVIARWHVRWKSEIKKIEANNKLNEMRTLNATRAQMQKDMAYLLVDIYNSDPHSDEALALRVFQALETAAAERSDELPPKEIMLALQNLYQWFVVERRNSSKGDDLSKKWIRRD